MSDGGRDEARPSRHAPATRLQGFFFAPETGLELNYFAVAK